MILSDKTRKELFKTIVNMFPAMKEQYANIDLDKYVDTVTSMFHTGDFNKTLPKCMGHFVSNLSNGKFDKNIRFDSIEKEKVSIDVKDNDVFIKYDGEQIYSTNIKTDYDLESVKVEKNIVVLSYVKNISDTEITINRI